MPCKACIESRKRRKAALERRAQRLAERRARGDNGVQIIIPKCQQTEQQQDKD